MRISLETEGSEHGQEEIGGANRENIGEPEGNTTGIKHEAMKLEAEALIFNAISLILVVVLYIFNENSIQDLDGFDGLKVEDECLDGSEFVEHLPEISVSSCQPSTEDHVQETDEVNAKGIEKDIPTSANDSDFPKYADPCVDQTYWNHGSTSSEVQDDREYLDPGEIMDLEETGVQTSVTLGASGNAPPYTNTPADGNGSSENQEARKLV